MTKKKPKINNESPNTKSIFIPFKNERDSIGRLIGKSKSLPGFKKKSSRRSKKAKHIDWSLLSEQAKTKIFDYRQIS